MVVRRAAAMLVKKRLVRRSHELLSALADVHRKAEGRIAVRAVSRYPLTRSATDAIIAYVRVRTGREPELMEELDETVIGGFVLHIGGDTVVDATVARAVREMSYHLTR